MADSEDYDGLKILGTNGKELRDLLQSEKHSEETCVIFRSESTCTHKLIIHHRSERLIPIIDWAEKETIDIVVHCANYAEPRLTEKARFVINDFLKKCMDVYKKGKVIEDLHLQFIWVKCVEDVNDHDNDHSDDGVDLNGGVVLCDPILIDLTIENFSSYLNEIYKILFQFSGKCSRTPKDFRHLLNSLKDIKSQGRQCFHPALLRYRPSILRELSNFATEVFLKIRHNSNFTKKIIGQLDIVFQKYRGYRPPMNFSQWHTHKVTPSIHAIITKLGKTETCPDFKNYRVRYLLFIRDCIHHCDGDKDPPSTKVQAAPGSGSSLGYLFGDGRK